MGVYLQVLPQRIFSWFSLFLPPNVPHASSATKALRFELCSTFFNPGGGAGAAGATRRPLNFSLMFDPYCSCVANEFFLSSCFPLTPLVPAAFAVLSV